MKTKIAVTIALVAMLFANICSSQEPQTSSRVPSNSPASKLIVGEVTDTEASNWSFSISTILMSAYYGTIFGGNFYDGPMSFTDFVASWKNSLGVTSFDLAIGQKLDRISKFNKDGGNEYDLTVNHVMKFGTKAYPVIADVGMVYLALYDLGRSRDDAFSQYLRLDFPIRADLTNGPLFQPYIQTYHYNMVGNNLEDKGWIGYAGIIRDQRLGGLKAFGKELALNIDVRVGVNGGTYDSKEGIEYYRLALGLPFKPGKWTIVPSIIGQLQGGPHQTYVHKNELFGTLFIKRDF